LHPSRLSQQGKAINRALPLRALSLQAMGSQGFSLFAFQMA